MNRTIRPHIATLSPQTVYSPKSFRASNGRDGEQLKEKEIAKQGLPIAAGESRTPKFVPVTACYPLERGVVTSDGISEVSYASWIFSATEITDGKYSTLADMRSNRPGSARWVKGMSFFNKAVAKDSGQDMSETGALVRSVASNTRRGSDWSKTRSIKNLATIMMPMSNDDVDSYTHNFNSLSMSKLDRAGGNPINFLSNAASDILGGALDSLTGGVMADNAEQIYQPGRAAYNGSNLRSKTFTWDLEPESFENYVELERIIAIFKVLQYGRLKSNSETLNKLVETIANPARAASNAIQTSIVGKSNGTVIIDALANALKNAMVLKSPPVWTIESYAQNGSNTFNNGFMGPAQITALTISNTPEGRWDPLAIQLNKPARVKISITFQEMIALTQESAV